MMSKKKRIKYAAVIYLAGTFAMTSLWLVATKVSYWFVLFFFIAWPLWLVATHTGNMWLVEWLPPVVWSPR